MNQRERNLLQELKSSQRCPCGGIYYPKNWMTKTREKLVRDGVLTVRKCCTREGWLVLVIETGGE